MITALSLLLFLTIAVIAAEQKTVTTQSKAAEVNGTVITLEDLTGEMNSYRQRMMQQGRILPEAELEGIRKELLNQLIDRELLFQDTKARGITIDSSIVQAELAKIKGRFESEEAYKKALAASKTSEAELSAKIIAGLAIRKLIDTVIAPNMTVTDKESKSFYIVEHIF